MKEKYLLLLLILLSVFSSYYFHSSMKDVMNPSCPTSQVVIDVGHGGSDPGKVGINHALEKDINLAIGKYLASYLEAAGYTVQMTRKTDTSLADTGVANEKLSDFKNRTAMITQAAPMAVISIHQNSYPAESVKGTQVFHSSLTESKLLASCIQEQCRRLLDPDNHRQIKENNDYYLFRHISCPIVIVECGFLSNYMEANLLITEDYQKKTAWAIYMGTVQFLKMFE